MMNFSLNLTDQNHLTRLVVQDGLLAEFPRVPEVGNPTNALLITDSIVGPLHAERLTRSLHVLGWTVSQHVLSAGEQSKNLDNANQVYRALADVKMPRDGLIVALGGGVVGDLAGFVAGTWMRGIRWINCPTTMEADVDACLGGKTAVNLPEGKNLVGVFHHPAAVVVDPSCLSTLTRRDVCAGLAEAVKHALLQSPDELAWLEANADKILALDRSTVCDLIERNLRFKGRIVSEDPFERTGRRILLNFGHTIGHAIETCAKGELRHGECVGLGMLAALQVSLRLGLHDGDLVDRARRLLERLELPTRLTMPLSRSDILDCVKLDKKSAGGNVRLVLLGGIGQPVVRDGVTFDLITEAFDSLW